MPKGAPAADAPAQQRDPFETTGAFAAPPPQGPDRAFPAPEQPFETTGAFVRPASWDDAPDATQTLGALPQDGPFDQRPSGQQPGPFDQQPGPFDQQSRPFDQGADVFDPRPMDRPGPFDPRAADGHHPFDASSDRTAAYERPAFDQRPGESTGAYDALAAESTGRFDPLGHDGTGRFDPPGNDGTARFDLAGNEATGRFDAPGHDGPPEPGDVKVYGEPTMVSMPAPAWADADNGFLPSDEASDGTKGDPEPRRRRGRRGPPKDPDSLDVPSGGGGRGRMALLSVAAVVVVLGGTVAGVKMMSGGGAADCPGGTCAAVQSSNQPAPALSEPPADEPVEDEEPVDEPVEDEESEPARSPKPTATYSAREPRRTTSSTPKPKPTRTKTKQAQEPVDEPIENVTEEEPAPEATPTTEVSLNPDGGTRPDNGDVPLPTATATETFQGVSSGSSVNVDFNVTNQRLATYTATMDVTNASDRTLNAFTLSVPVRGRILSVEGATWTQDGDLLIVDLSTPIAVGESTEISIAATGRAGRPTNCGLVGGDCAVS
ncbi:hypothetical protein ACIBQX_16040 [Nonomuraea sp. NPDC049714]|uniref:hypothetical protein n=1 Tax=Nonomuraea sp. NPDC049714 TaxID=3364357 RepID=UPI00379397B2